MPVPTLFRPSEPELCIWLIPEMLFFMESYTSDFLLHSLTAVFPHMEHRSIFYFLYRAMLYAFKNMPQSEIIPGGAQEISRCVQALDLQP